jgi:endonuclease/exonuclease/phosphatase family metal-dependent hydrolase
LSGPLEHKHMMMLVLRGGRALFFVLGFIALPMAHADQAVRIATWNVLDVGEPGSQQYWAAYDVLTRLGADVVAVQEVASNIDATYIVNLAVDLGYPNVTVAPGGPFGADRTAIMADFAMQPGVSWTSAVLSGDPAAMDITRYILEAEVDVTGTGDWLSVIVNHWKSGATNTDEYRRAIESTRISQVVQNIEDAAQPYVIVGDVNEDIRDGALTPSYFTALPEGLPASFVTGAGIQARLHGQGLFNNPFAPVTTLATMLDAQQVDADYATRPASGRRLDYIFASANIAAEGVQVFDCADENLLLGLPLVGDPLAPEVCLTASDHLPVVADLLIPALNPCPPDGQLVLANKTLAGQVRLACETISLGPSLIVTATAEVELLARTHITLRPGVSVQAGALITATIQPALAF